MKTEEQELVNIPVGLMESDLLIEEIGALVILLSFFKMDEKWKERWLDNYTFNRIINKLMDDNVIQTTKDGDNVEIEIDVSDVL